MRFDIDKLGLITYLCGMKKVVLIGSGNVATHLGKAFIDSGIKVLQVWSRSYENASFLAKELKCNASADIKNIIPDADAYIFSVKDDVLEEVVRMFPYKDKFLIHTAGSISIDLLKDYSSKYGVFYPLQTFSKQKEVDFTSVPILIEASSPTLLNKLSGLATSISEHVLPASSEQRKYLHISAVFSCNFTNYMYSLAESLLEENGLSFDLVRPLIKETAEKALLHSPKDVQTGPAVRKDMKIVNSHLDLLDSQPDVKALYAVLSERIIKDL